jgi:hypothetical protein
VKKKQGNGDETSGIMKNIKDSTHEARAALVLSDVSATPREQRTVLL